MSVEYPMGLKRRQVGSAALLSGVEALESRQLFSATLVQITIPTPPTTTKHPKVHKPVKPVVKPTVKHQSVSGGEQHAKIGYEIFAG
jgi:hypothetical protein